ncbi:MAG TPA: acyl-ACP thioesterase domain-containing protein [Candidatus Limnocylindria bacterium]|nr:acyl-ACP thioesterase domain-containing protein [Candidatus Limnocylindria bacterium]
MNQASAASPAAAFTLDPGLTGQDARPVDGVDNGYLAGYRVRFDEAGPEGAMRTATLLRYAQDIAWRHSEHLGFDRDWYASRGLGWVVRGVRLELDQPVPMGHTLRVTTAVVGHRRIWARRMVEVRLSHGGLAARVTTDWVLLDGRGRVVRIPVDFGVAFVNPEVKDDILRVPAPQGPPAASLSVAVRPRDLDPLHHVNNAVYVDWLEEALLAAGWPATGRRTVRLEYLASAASGDEIDVDLFGGAMAWSARIRRADGADLLRASGTTTSS